MNTSDAAQVEQTLEHPAKIAAEPRWSFRRMAIVVAALVLVGLITGFVPRWHQRNVSLADSRELAVPTVSVVSPAPGQAADGLLLPAEIKPWLEAAIYARANGYVKRWLVDIGAHVGAGQLLAEIDTPEIDQQLDQARAQLAESEAAMTLAKTTAERWAALLKTASVSEQENAEKQADFSLKSATVEAQRANVRRLEELQGFQRVVAPFAGTITSRNTDIGDLIVAGSGRELFHLAQTQTLRVYVRVPQSAARGIAIGQSAQVMIPEITGRTFPAKVVTTSGAMSPISRTLLTELRVDNPDDVILSDSYALVHFTDPNSDVTLTLPSNTVLFRADGLQVAVVQSDGSVQLRNVSVGRDFGKTVEILSGVTPADRVVVNPTDSLVSGVLVRVAEAPKAVAAK
jgi:RND family efflux transporter MFP subunit